MERMAGRKRMVDPKPHAPCSMPHAYFLIGPTACGKSAVTQYIAERGDYRLVSADSMNIYRGMNIGTAKPTAAERERVDYAGIDLVDPAEKFSVAQYIEAVRPAFDCDRPVIVTGGTGLYIKCLTEGFDEVPPENTELPAELEAIDRQALDRRARREAAELYSRLTEDDRRNPRRLIRIVEKATGGTPSPASADNGDVVPPGAKSMVDCSGSWNTKPKPILVGLYAERGELHRGIAQRVEQMYSCGLLDEARALMNQRLSETAMQAIGYAEAFAVLNGLMTLKEAKEKTVIRTRQLAKRQMTWFRNQLKVEWIDTADYPGIERLAEAVSNSWKKYGAAPIMLD